MFKPEPPAAPAALKDPQAIVEMASAFYASATLFAALDLDLFGRLNRLAPATAATLAADGTLDLRATRLLLDGCVALGLAVKQDDHYANAPAAAACLVAGSPADLTRAIRYNQDVYAPWGRLAQLARTGRPVEPPAVHLGDDPERTRRFVLAMHGRAMGIGRAIVPLLDLAGARSLLDIGGGPGAYAMLLAQAAPQLACTVLDLPPVVAVARELLAQAGLAERVRCLPGDYHTTSFPSGQDVITIFGVLHQESPTAIVDILRRAHAALNPGGRLYILDMMTDATHAWPRFSALFAVNMALTTDHGWVFSDREISGWLAEAGFVAIAVRPVPPPMPHWLAVARKQGGAA